MEGGRRTRLGNCLVCARRPLLIFIGGREGGASIGGAQVGGVLLGVPPKLRAPLPYITEVEGNRGGGDERK